MNFSKLIPTITRYAAIAATGLLLQGAVHTATATELDDKGCLTCHDSKSKPITVTNDKGDERKLSAFNHDNAASGVHAKLSCVSCHTNIVDNQANHKKAKGVKGPDCASCHTVLWDQKKTVGGAGQGRLEIVAKNVEAYRNSFHARPDSENPDLPKANCKDCHSTHEFSVPALGTLERQQWRKTTSDSCGAKCHEDQLEDYKSSVHGKAVLDGGDLKAATCVDCHSTHKIEGASSKSFKLKNIEACGTCHKEELESYRDTYHGQVSKLGYVDTAKCSDCHGSHGILGPKDPDSKVHPDNRLKTCKKCHNDKKPGMFDATAGFATFYPHANGHDFAKYPQMWVATKIMQALLIGVFIFFWAHSGLWYYREWQERKAGKTVHHVRVNMLEEPEHLGKKYVKRFSWGWRIAHLLFAVSTMTLVLTGTTALFAESPWAPWVANAFGGPRNLGFTHRIAASIFAGIFIIHTLYIIPYLLRKKDFRWFGPESLLPNWKDAEDVWGVFKWFFGKGPRPLFDRWTYGEKFEYWAVFWGVNVIGWSGLMLAFPHVTATYLPGWVFNVGTLVHSYEACLAAVFAFTVHFFNNHFRPDKLPPPDVAMFTGTISLEELRHERPAQYQRLIDSGELEKYLVDAPSRQMHIGSVILGLTLITIGLILLVLVAIGYFTS